MKNYFAIVSLGLLLNSCYPGGAEYVDQVDLVYTNYNPNFDFSTLSTFTLPDSIPFVDDENRGTKIEFLDEPYRSTILANLKTQMESRGYTYVDHNSNADWLILPTVSKSTSTYYYYDPAYWNYWAYPDWGAGWGWGYPGYGGGTYLSSIKTGTVMVQAVWDDPSISEDQPKPVQWVGVLSGLLQGSQSSVNTRIDRNIPQMFAQSEYFRK
jgi:hypothetical protein